MVDIIQAVGRVIRKAEGKQIGTIVIPVFIDETEDTDHVLSQSAFEPVWQVLKALRAHDRRLADELDQLRLSLGKRSKSGGRIRLPGKIKLDVPRLLLRDFEQAFYVRTVEQTTDRPPLTIPQILAWVDAHKAATGDWPKYNSGRVTGTDETWAGIEFGLYQGRRGLAGGSTLANLLAEYRDVRNKKNLPPFTIAQILGWADKHKAATGDWPNRTCGKVTGTEETWGAIENALKGGFRGFPGGLSVAKLLAQYRSVRNVQDLSTLTIAQILGWADEHRAKTGGWPKQKSGKVTGTDETWLGIASALHQGGRGLPGGSSLANLLAEHRSVRNVQNLSPLTIEQILVWVDEHKAAMGEWPKKASGNVKGTDESWSGIDNALKRRSRDLPGESSLANLLAEYCGVRNVNALSPLTIEQILIWVDEYRDATGEWPKPTSGEVVGTDELWKAIDVGLVQGQRGLPGGSSLAKLLAEHRAVRNPSDLAPLTIEQILVWADEHRTATGEWPKPTSGKVRGTEETWGGINNALQRGGRDLPGHTSLAKLLAEHRGVRNIHDLPLLTIEQILVWVDEHRAATGEWPKQTSGKVTGTDETWRNIDRALRDGRRGLPGRSSLPSLRAEHRSVRNITHPPPLTIEQILVWADEHRAATGGWPKQTSGKVTGTDEKWNNIDRALRDGRRRLPGGSSLAKLLDQRYSKM